MFIIDSNKVQNNNDLFSQLFLKAGIERALASNSRIKKPPVFCITNNKEPIKPSRIVKQFLESNKIDLNLPKLESRSKSPEYIKSSLKNQKMRSISQNSKEVQVQIKNNYHDFNDRSSVYCYLGRQKNQIQENKRHSKKENKNNDLSFDDILKKVSLKVDENKKRNSQKSSLDKSDEPKFKDMQILQQPITNKVRQKRYQSCPRDSKDDTTSINITQYYLNNSELQYQTISPSQNNQIKLPQILSTKNSARMDHKSEIFSQNDSQKNYNMQDIVVNNTIKLNNQIERIEKNNEKIDKKQEKDKIQNSLSVEDNIVNLLQTSIQKKLVQKVLSTKSTKDTKITQSSNRNIIDLTKIQQDNIQNVSKDIQPSLIIDRQNFDHRRFSQNMLIKSQSSWNEDEKSILSVRYKENFEEIEELQFEYQEQNKIKKVNRLPTISSNIQKNQQNHNSQFLVSGCSKFQRQQLDNDKPNCQILCKNNINHDHQLEFNISQYLIQKNKQSIQTQKDTIDQINIVNFECPILSEETIVQRIPSIKDRMYRNYFKSPKSITHKNNKYNFEEKQSSSIKNQSLIDFCLQPITNANMNVNEEVQQQIVSQNFQKITQKLSPILKQTKQNTNSNSPIQKKTAKKSIHPPEEVTAQSWSIYDFDDRSQIDGKFWYVQRETASLTKIMTFYVAYKFFEEINLNTKLILFNVSDSCIFFDGTSANLMKDTWLSVWDLFHGMLIPDGNDCAELIGMKVGAMMLLKQNGVLNPQMNMISLNEELDKQQQKAKMTFLIKMNDTCKQLGMNSSFFSNVTGLTDSNNISTSQDIGLLCCECMNIQEFRQIVRKKEHIAYIYDNQSQKSDKIWLNTNKLLSNGFRGIQAGITGTAGPCLSSFIKLKDSSTGIKKSFVIVLLNCNTVEDRWKDSCTLAKWAIKSVQNNNKSSHQ